ncbi:MAG: anaerobic ribonucleoside-triphosphate reductase activating protein, partial [Candidatus Omnitrophota bacterium]
MRIGGFQKLTLADYPGKVAATVFTQGCNFRCGFCHNPELVCPEKFQPAILEQEILDCLKLRQGKLDGVVITGGKPTLQADLADFILKVKKLGFLVKLDTNGSLPNVVRDLIECHLIDYVAMDVKTSLEKYSQAVGCQCDVDKIQESISLIVKSGLPYQLRTTLVKEYCLENDLR